MEILNYHFVFFFTILFNFVSIGEIQLLRDQLTATQVTEATLPLHAEDEEQKKTIIELEKVRDEHNISAMLSICKPGTRGTVSKAVAKFVHETGHTFSLDRIGLPTAQIHQRN
jgi:hypothetical protein